MRGLDTKTCSNKNIPSRPSESLPELFSLSPASSEKIRISSKAAFNKVPGFLETGSPLSPPSTLEVLAPSRDQFVFLSVRLEWGFRVSVSDSVSDGPECDFGGGEDRGRDEWSPLK